MTVMSMKTQTDPFFLKTNNDGLFPGFNQTWWTKG
jgi:hypothetical protein